MNARILCSTGALCFFLAISAWADTNSIVSNIQSQLKLTQAQAGKITPIIEEENQKLSKILTPDQMDQWLNLLNQIHQKHKKSKHSAAGAGTATPSGSKP